MAEPSTQEAAPARRDRRAIEQVAASASTLLFVAIVLMVNYIAFRNYERADWTEQGMYTLSDKSRKVLTSLTEDVDVYLFMSRAEAGFEDTDELLKRYQAASPHVKLHYVDPDREPGEFKLLAQRFGVAAGLIETGEARADVAAVIARGDKTWHVRRDDLVGWDVGGVDGEHELNVKAEQALTGAIVQAESGRATKLCVTTGHGEWSLDKAAERSLDALEQGLRHDNLDWQAAETLGKSSLPEDCDAVLVLGPVRAFSEAEAKLLLDYVEKGGNALIALDPVIEHDEVQPTGFESALLDHGIRVDRSLVLELNPERLLSPNTVEFVATSFGDHVTTRPIAGGARVFISMARSISPSGTNDRVEILMRSSDQAFGETEIANVADGSEPVRGPGDIEGPVSLAVAVQLTPEGDVGEDQPGGRLVVVGDSDFLQPAFLEAPELANFHLASAWIGWLAEREALIEIPPKKVKGGEVVFTQEGLFALFFRVAILIPGAAFLLGLGVWLNRRQ